MTLSALLAEYRRRNQASDDGELFAAIVAAVEELQKRAGYEAPPPAPSPPAPPVDPLPPVVEEAPPVVAPPPEPPVVAELPEVAALREELGSVRGQLLTTQVSLEAERVHAADLQRTNQTLVQQLEHAGSVIRLKAEEHAALELKYADLLQQMGDLRTQHQQLLQEMERSTAPAPAAPAPESAPTP